MKLAGLPERPDQRALDRQLTRFFFRAGHVGHSPALLNFQTVSEITDRIYQEMRIFIILEFTGLPAR